MTWGFCYRKKILTCATLLPHMTLKEVFLAIILLLNFGTGVFVVLKKPRDAVHQTFFLMMLGVMMWGLGLILMVQTEQFMWSRLIEYGFLVLVAGIIAFAYVFPDQERFPVNRWPVFLPLLFLWGIVPFGLIIEGAIFNGNNSAEPINGKLFPVFGVILFGYLLLMLFLFIRKYIKTRGIARRQMIYLFSGLSILVVSALVFDLILPSIGIAQLNFIGPLSAVVFAGLTAIAILKHQLMDIRFVIQRGVIYSAILALAGGLYASLILILGRLFRDTSDAPLIISSTILVVVGMFGAPMLERVFRSWTDRIFFKDRYDYADALQELSGVLYYSTSIASTIQNSTKVLKSIFRTEHVEIQFSKDIVKDKDSHENRRLVEMQQPIVFSHEIIGWIHVGVKKSGDLYRPKDKKLLATFAAQAAIALEKARLFQEVEDYSKTLEQRVIDRTERITTLQQEQEQMMVDISHNLQTPLAVLRTEATTVGDSSRFEKSIDELSQYVYRLMQFAEQSLSHEGRNPERFDFSGLVREQVEYFHTIATQKGIQLHASIQEDIFVTGYQDGIKDVLVNLVSNAFKYRTGGLDDQVWISLQQSNNMIELIVRDNGVGINKKDLPDIFRRFYRSRHISKEREGTGLGLAICKRIVEAHGGEIQVTSVEGEGSEFKILI